MKFPQILLPGQICWSVIRNHREDPSHGAEHGPGKERPGILVTARNGVWLVIGTTSKSIYSDGLPRIRIPPEEWEGAHDGLRGRPGYLWGQKVQYVPEGDIHDYIGLASAPCAASAVNPSSTSTTAFEATSSMWISPPGSPLPNGGRVRRWEEISLETA